ncbi:Casein kinase I -like protein 2 [Sarcoptes scabiei]|uniref:Casein kinase I -like protein 2 n=1 Tax=Sarcoptes scabiei TaxID=52283 RepID=A0A834R6K3_SARSC|nr:Casein kinase I -like protein 2 [Sarcoptes scabiei]
MQKKNCNKIQQTMSQKILLNQCRYPMPLGLLNGKYLVEKHFNSEIFRNLFVGTFHDNDRKQFIFIKFKHSDCLAEQKSQRWEYHIYKLLFRQETGSLRVPRPFYFGPLMCYEMIILELLGPNLNDLWIRCGRHFSIRTLSQLGYQLVYLMKYLHDNGIVYQNIRPEHFLYGPSGLDKWTWLYVVDLKHSKFWCPTQQNGQPLLNQHIQMKKNSNPLIKIGTPPRFMSINAHKGLEQTRRDDLESIGYMLIYLYRGGELPWIDLESLIDPYEKHSKMADYKMRYCSQICHNMLPEFEQFLIEVKALGFEDQPDYQSLAALFLNVQQQIGFIEMDDLYDWDCFHQPLHPRFKNIV